MKKTRKAIFIFLFITALILTIASLLSLFRDTPSRFLKMLDFPRIQFFIASLVNLILLIIIGRRRYWYNWLMFFGLFIGMVIQGSYLIHYTPLVPETVPTVKEIQFNDDRVSLLIANVQMSNREAQRLIDIIGKKEPDLILAMEVDSWWDEELTIIEKQYPYSQETINDVAYGMTLYSKFPLEEIVVDYLNHEKVPSFESTVTLASGKQISFHSVHPVPPTHFKDLPDNAGQQEMALKKLGAEIQGRKLPTILAGDLNDVVWSHVDELTDTEGILFDVRTGRGIFTSYNAENFLMRWPLDHVFVTREFRLEKLERLSGIGSDHFPIYVELVL